MKRHVIFSSLSPRYRINQSTKMARFILCTFEFRCRNIADNMTLCTMTNRDTNAVFTTTGYVVTTLKGGSLLSKDRMFTGLVLSVFRDVCCLNNCMQFASAAVHGSM